MRLLLSCISTKHSVLKQHWDETSQETQCPLTVLGSYQKPNQDLGGLLCFIEDLGCSQKTVAIKMAAGMVDTDRGVFVTSFGSIHKVDTDSGVVHQNVISSPLFNALHSISRTRLGYLVPSTSLDLLLNFSRSSTLLLNSLSTHHIFHLSPSPPP